MRGTGIFEKSAQPRGYRGLGYVKVVLHQMIRCVIVEHARFELGELFFELAWHFKRLPRDTWRQRRDDEVAVSVCLYVSDFEQAFAVPN